MVLPETARQTKIDITNGPTIYVLRSCVETAECPLYEADGIYGGTNVCVCPPRYPLHHRPAFVWGQGHVLCWGEVFW